MNDMGPAAWWSLLKLGWRLSRGSKATLVLLQMVGNSCNRVVQAVDRRRGEKGGGGGNNIKEKEVLPASTKNKPAGLPVRRIGGENMGGKMERDRQKKRPAPVERGKM